MDAPSGERLAPVRESGSALLNASLVPGLHAVLHAVLTAHTQLAAGAGADEQGFLSQDWRPFNSRRWLAEHLQATASPEARPPQAAEVAAMRDGQ